MMAAIARVVRYEWVRWRGRRSTWGVAAFFVAGTFLYGQVAKTLGGAGVIPGGGEAGGYHLAYRTAAAMLRLAGIFALAWGAFAIAPETEAGRHRMPLLRVSRAAFVAGKAVFLAAVCAALATVILLVSLGVGAWAHGLRGIHVGTIVIHSGGELLASGLIATLLTFAPLAALVALGVAISAVSRSGEMALLFSLMAAALLWGLSFEPHGAPFLSSRHTDGPLRSPRAGARG